MRRSLKYLFIFLISFLFLINVEAKEVTMYFFYGEGCPHCAKEKILLEKLEKEYDNLTIKRYETYYNEDNRVLMEQKKQELNITSPGVPLTIIEDEYILGYTTSFDDKFYELVEKYSEDEVEDTNNSNYTLPLIGKIDVKNVSLILVSIVLGLVDGFNPCAMWILIFLLSMLIGMKDKKRMIILGLTFLITSALVYMLIMLSFLEIVVSITTSVVLRNIIAVIALIGSFINLRSFIKSNKSGCEVVSDNRRKKIIDKIKKFTSEKSFILALFGIIGLAISVNIIELACSAGFPVMFTSILALNEVSKTMSILYTFIYILFFLFDDLLIFFIALVTFKITGISTKYSRYSKLIGGIIMLLIGVLLIFKPEWIMLNF